MKKFKLSIPQLIAYGIPILLTLSLIAIYLINSDFYLSYVLSGLNREAQAVETLTFFSALFSAFILFKNAFKIRKKDNYKLSFFALILIGLAAFFFAGEEISWGQSYLFWETPEIYRDKSIETNLHNSPIPINSLGNIFLISVFVIFPFLYKKQKETPLFISLSIAVPKGPAIFCVIYGYLWRVVKITYMTLYSKEVLNTSRFYMEFLEQINEQKEMLIAVGLLIYAININKRLVSI